MHRPSILAFAAVPPLPTPTLHFTTPCPSTLTTYRSLPTRRLIHSSAADPRATSPLQPITENPLTKHQRSSDPTTQNNPPNTIRVIVRRTFKRAQAAERDGDISKARSLLRQCLALDRRDAHSWLALARLEARSGVLDIRSDGIRTAKIAAANAARALFEEGLRECPDSVHLLQAWAVLEHRCGDRDTARKLFARGNAIEPDNPYISHAWGLLEQRVGNNKKARELFQKAVAMRPHAEVCTAWAVLEARDGNVERARELFEKGLKAYNTTSSIAAIYRSWAEMEERLGDLPRARELLTKAISSHPQMTEAYIGLANLEARRGCISRALELMSTAAGVLAYPPASVFNAWAQIELTYRGRLDDAKELLRQGNKIHPFEPVLLQSMGTLEDKSGNSQEARELFQRSIDARPTAAAFVAWALLEEREGNLDEAERLFEEALATDPMHGAAYNAYGMMKARKGRLDAARGIFARGLKMYPSPSVWHGYGQLELKLGRNPDRARELFRRGVAQTREDTAFVWHSWGTLELTQKNILEARRVFEDALMRYPRNSRMLVGAALAEAASWHRTGANERAARDFFKRAVAADPTHAHAWQTWGVFELRRGRPDAAEALFRRGLRLCPNHGALWQAWGVLETFRGNFAKARKLFGRGTQLNPNHVHLVQAWACMEVRAGNFDRARELLDRALGFDPNHGPVWNAYGLLEARQGTIARARQLFVTGIKRSPGHAPLYRTFGQTEARLGNYERARELFKEGLRIDPRHAPLYHTLSKLEAMMGNVEGLAELKKQAEKYFGSEAEAMQAMRSGDEADGSQEDANSSDDHLYGSLTTPMESALDGESVLQHFDRDELSQDGKIV